MSRPTQTTLEAAAQRYLSRYQVLYHGRPIEGPRRLIGYMRSRRSIVTLDPLIYRDRHWYGLQISPGHEFKIAKTLTSAGYPVWLPLVLQYKVHMAPPPSYDHPSAPVRMWSVRETLRAMPDFPGYLFVAGPPAQTLTSSWIQELLHPALGITKRQGVFDCLHDGADILCWSSRELIKLSTEMVPLALVYGSSVVIRRGEHYGTMGTVVHQERHKYWVETIDQQILVVAEDAVAPARFADRSVVGVVTGTWRGHNGYLLADCGETLRIWLGDRVGDQRIATTSCAVETLAAEALGKPMPPLAEQLEAFMDAFMHPRGLSGYTAEKFSRLVALWRADHRTVRQASRALLTVNYYDLSTQDQARLRHVFRHAATH